MKITFVLPYAGLAGGVRVIAKLAEALVAQGDTVNAVSCELERPSIKQRIKDVLKGKGFAPVVDREPSHFDHLDIEHVVAPYSPPIKAKYLPGADWVVATWFETANWVNDYSAEYGKKAYFIQQYEANFGFSPELVDYTWKLPLRKIVCSQWLSDLAVQRFNSPHLPVVNNGVDFEQFYATGERRRSETPTIGFLYSPPRSKGYEDLQVITDIVRKTIPTAKVLAYGTVPPPQLMENTEFHQRPAQGFLREIYCRCDVWLCASKSEGFHLPPHEAMACRTPVVSTNVGGPSDMIQHGVDGFLRHPGENEELAGDVLEVLTCPPERWKRYSEAAHAKAKRYTWAQAATNFKAALS